MKRAIIMTLGVSIVGMVAYLAGVSQQAGSTFLVDALSQTMAQATSSLVPDQADEACIYGGELFSENSVICYGSSRSVLVCKSDKWASVKVESRFEDCDRDGDARNYLSPLS